MQPQTPFRTSRRTCSITLDRIRVGERAPAAGGAIIDELPMWPFDAATPRKLLTACILAVVPVSLGADPQPRRSQVEIVTPRDPMRFRRQRST
jgi:hypothetical protein